MDKLTIAEAKRLNDTTVTENHLRLHAANVAACMGAMADHFGADKEHWEAVGYLHDYDYEKYPEEHLPTRRNPCELRVSPRRISGPFSAMAIPSAQMWSLSLIWRRAFSQWMS